MEHIGMDLGKRESQMAILTEDGELINRRIRTERPRLVEIFGRRPQAKILLADVESRDPDGAAARSHHPSCAGESSLATDSAKRRMTNLAQRARHPRVRRPHTRGGERGR